ncbi:MAG: FAD-dependent oxidoreductase [Pirellulaceae bacterium]|nr:FAD-dependent oxidoreductase [Pirellulaceae bacterium]
MASEHGTDFRVFTYAQATLREKTVEIRPAGTPAAEPIATIEPAAIVNATGAWVDDTLARLPVPSRRLMGGTKGSHFLTHQPRIKELLGGQGIYTEARDGRPVFILPFLDGTLVGTTDIPFAGDPAAAIATEEELDYLVAAAADVFPDAGLARDDITLHYCGVRPLPFVDAKTPAAITRRHQLVWNDQSPVPLVSLVGGKLTTCRSLAEETATAVLGRLGHPLEHNSRDRPIRPTQVDDALAAGLASSKSAAAWSIGHEWGTRLEDLVERRLLLHFSPDLSRRMLADLAGLLIQQGKLDLADAQPAIERCAARLKAHFGIDLSRRETPS